MFCSNCGLENPNEATYCVHCGSLQLEKDRQRPAVPFARPARAEVLRERRESREPEGQPAHAAGWGMAERGSGFRGFPVFGVPGTASALSSGDGTAAGTAAGTVAGTVVNARGADPGIAVGARGVNEGFGPEPEGQPVSEPADREQAPSLLSAVRRWMGRSRR